MTAKPTMQHHEASLPFPCAAVSGTMFSKTTKIMAPAANANAYGSIISASETDKRPSRPAMGSTMPLSWPYQNAFKYDWPDAYSGSDTAKPFRHLNFDIISFFLRFFNAKLIFTSGKFWIPIPIARLRAFWKVARGVFPILKIIQTIKN